MKSALELLGRNYAAQLTGYVILSDDQLEAFAWRAREEALDIAARKVSQFGSAIQDEIRALTVKP